MKKRFLMALCLSGLSISISYAAGTSGAYVGLTGGSSQSRIRYEYDNGRTNTIYGKGNAHMDRPNLAFVAGWGFVILPNCLHLGLEGQLDTNFGGAQRFKQNEQIKISGKRQGLGYAVLARIGAAITPNNILYFGVGAKSVAWRYRVMNTHGEVRCGVSKRSFRPVFEGGTEGLFGKRTPIGWRLSYSFTYGRDLKVKSFPATHTLAGVNSGARFKPHEHAVRAGIFYLL